LDIITVHDKLTRLPLFHLKSVMLDHFIAKNATGHKVNSYCTVAISYRTFCVEKHTILGPAMSAVRLCAQRSTDRRYISSFPWRREQTLRRSNAAVDSVHPATEFRWQSVMKTDYCSILIDNRWLTVETNAN